MLKGIYKPISQIISTIIICVFCLIVGTKISIVNTSDIEEIEKKENYHVSNLYEYKPESTGVEADPIEVETIIQEDSPVYTNRWSITEITQEEKDLLAKVLYLEAHNTGIEGCQKVAVVIFNRYLNGKFFGGNLPCITSVLSAPGQFTTYKKASTDISFSATDQEYSAIESVLKEEVSEDILNMSSVYFNGDGRQNYFW